MSEAWHQRVIKHSGRAYHVPNFMFCFVALDLVWEVIRENVSPEMRQVWPWRFVILDVGTAGTAIGVLGGFLLARNQFMRATRPSLGWTGSPRPPSDNMVLASKWVVCLHNGGPGICTAKQVDYRFALKDDCSSEEPVTWSSLREVVGRLALVGLEIGRHYWVDEHTPGAVYTVVTDFGNRKELAAFGDRALALLRTFDVRLIVEDITGESHERVIRCLYAAHEIGKGSGGTLPE